jgi:hypothetical protein
VAAGGGGGEDTTESAGLVEVRARSKTCFRFIESACGHPGDFSLRRPTHWQEANGEEDIGLPGLK